MTKRQFKCASCGGVFDAAWTEEEALAEMRDTFGELKPDERARVCEVCYQRIMGGTEGVRQE